MGEEPSQEKGSGIVPDTGKIVGKLNEASFGIINLKKKTDLENSGVSVEQGPVKFKNRHQDEIQQVRVLLENAAREISDIEHAKFGQNQEPIVKTIASKLRNDYNLLVKRFTTVIQSSTGANPMNEYQRLEESFTAPSGSKTHGYNTINENEITIQEEERMGLLQAVYDQEPARNSPHSTFVNDPTLSLIEIRRREGNLRNIECGVTEVNQMLRHISVMVNEQQDCIDIIDTNMSAVKDDAIDTTKQLESAKESQKSYRKFRTYIFFAIIIIFTLYLLFRVI